ncbi:putative LppA-like lipoprotein [Nocardia tenerifensis]|uniref:Putative LppA-like lipoprotein n=1 Tax=Nocardia tenerifensis TaxID=228006 RepID=A0A318KAG5_9NOCA|nr:LppA family lipoprotein [Nocardia tenerifensis]PXX53399.1 putative LppA-like lipoprotein [Nocardia tenerifensis]
MTKTTAMGVLAALVAVTVLSGCGDRLKDTDRPASQEDIAHAEAEMRKLPSAEASERDLIALIRQIAEAVKTAAPELDWRTKNRRGQNTLGCPSPYLETEGVSFVTDSLVSSVPITDTQWPGVLQIARDMAARDGITALTVRADTADRHDVILHSPDHGNEIVLITAESAVISGVTGCRYLEADLRKQPGN